MLSRVLPTAFKTATLFAGLLLGGCVLPANYDTVGEGYVVFNADVHYYDPYAVWYYDPHGVFGYDPYYFGSGYYPYGFYGNAVAGGRYHGGINGGRHGGHNGHDKDRGPGNGPGNGDGAAGDNADVAAVNPNRRDAGNTRFRGSQGNPSLLRRLRQKMFRSDISGTDGRGQSPAPPRAQSGSQPKPAVNTARRNQRQSASPNRSRAPTSVRPRSRPQRSSATAAPRAPRQFRGGRGPIRSGKKPN